MTVKSNKDESLRDLVDRHLDRLPHLDPEVYMEIMRHLDLAERNKHTPLGRAYRDILMDDLYWEIVNAQRDLAGKGSGTVWIEGWSGF